MKHKLNWKYALVEILIVIIGVSIAFLLNNWATDRKDLQTERLYLKNIVLDLQTDIAHLDSNANEINKQLQIVQQVFPFLGKPDTVRDTVFMKVFQLASLVEFIPEDATYQALINSGDLKLIRSFTLRAKIASHYANYRHLQSDYERQEIFNKMYLGDFFMDKVDYMKVYQRDYSFMDEPKLRNILLSLKGILQLKLNTTESAKQRCEQLLENIEKEVVSER